MLIANHKRETDTDVAGADWTGYTTGYMQLNVKHSDVSFYSSVTNYNNGNHLTYNTPAGYSSWDRVGIADMMQETETGSTDNSYYSLKETPESKVSGSAGTLCNNRYYRVFEIQSYVFNWLKWVPMSEADTDAKLAQISDAANQDEAVSDADRYIRGQYGVSEKLIPNFTLPNAECDGIADFENTGGANKQVTWNNNQVGVKQNTVTTNSNGIFVFKVIEVKTSQFQVVMQITMLNINRVMIQCLSQWMAETIQHRWHRHQPTHHKSMICPQ